ncbi:MAG: hypothetical protein ACI8TX_001240 [Hyphomicrobiaceae bacterium]|jgi:hypothetical protein
MRSLCHAIYLLVLFLAFCAPTLQATPAAADPCDPLLAPEILEADPCDPIEGHYAMLPGVPLIIPADGARGSWSTGDPVIDPGSVGDIDIAVRLGVPADPDVVPAPKGASGDSLPIIEIGGGLSGQGTEVQFTAMITHGPDVEPYGNIIRGTELDKRPVGVYAFADLDGDGTIGPTDDDGSFDNEIERQEALAMVGRQAGQFSDGTFTQTLGIQIAAPESMGGLTVGLFSGGYTGQDPDLLWGDGAPIFTSFPFFPPLDPSFIVVVEGHPTSTPPPPDPEGPLLLQYRPAEFLLPEPNTQGLGTPFAILVDGSNTTIDQFTAVSGPPIGIELFTDIDVGTFKAAARMNIRPAPAANGITPTLVRSVESLNLPAGTEATVRLMQVDALGNIADPVASVLVELAATGGASILAPDSDGDASFELVRLDKTEGVSVTLSTVRVEQSGTFSITQIVTAPEILGRRNANRTDESKSVTALGRRLLRHAVIEAEEDLDSDGDGILDDGNASGVAGDRPCTSADIAAGTACDDNCPTIVNPKQTDDRNVGRGNCCNGDCALDLSAAGCSECPGILARFRSIVRRARIRVRPGGGLTDDRVGLSLKFDLNDFQEIGPDVELLAITVSDGDRVHWYAPLPAKFTRKSAKAPFKYRDPEGPLAGIRRARVKIRNTRVVDARIFAKGTSIVETTPGESISSFVITIEIGDDSFSTKMECKSSLRAVRCVRR